MKTLTFPILLLVLLLSGLPIHAQSPLEVEPREFEMQDGDTTYTMKRYVMVLLQRGDKADEFSPGELEELQSGHMANISRLAQEGIIAVAGPFGDDTALRGIFVMDVGSIEEAEAHLATDPMIAAGRLKAECHPWWCAKGTRLP